MADFNISHSVQVHASHYLRSSYLSVERWASFWHQIDAVRGTKPARVLEIGVGSGIVADSLKKVGIIIETLDIDHELAPTFVGSVTHIPVQDAVYDTVLCAEVLEHLPWNELYTSLVEIRRVTKRFAVITVPHSGYVFSLMCKVPLLKWMRLGFKLPHFWKAHVFNGQHYWETGKRGCSRAHVRSEIEKVGFRIRDERIHPDDPAHYCLICEKV